jgi:hypothetical protein
LAADLAESGLHPHATDTGPGRSGRDILGTAGIAIEVKACARFSPLSFHRQATANSDGDVPLVVCRLNGQGPKAIDEWLCVLARDLGIDLLVSSGLDYQGAEVKRRGFDPLPWIRRMRGAGHIAYAWFRVRDADMMVIRWGDMKRVLRAVSSDA